MTFTRLIQVWRLNSSRGNTNQTLSYWTWLPEMDGYEIARRLRQRPQLANMWLIALTGYGQES